jgi:hypothetical protein
MLRGMYYVEQHHDDWLDFYVESARDAELMGD